MTSQPHPWATHWEKNFRKQMLRLREARKMTQTDLARELQRHGLRFHQQTIQRIESGERPVRLNEAHVIADILEVDLRSMTTATSSPQARDLLTEVDRLRSRSGNAAASIEEVVNEWLNDCVRTFTTTMSSRIEATESRSDRELDDVTRWGLAWAAKVIDAFGALTDAWDKLAGISGDAAGYHFENQSQGMMPNPEEITALARWCDDHEERNLYDLALEDGNVLYGKFPAEQENADTEGSSTEQNL